jgi:hypothetical protein
MATTDHSVTVEQDASQGRTMFVAVCSVVDFRSIRCVSEEQAAEIGDMHLSYQNDVARITGREGAGR